MTTTTEALKMIEEREKTVRTSATPINDVTRVLGYMCDELWQEDNKELKRHAVHATAIMLKYISEMD